MKAKASPRIAETRLVGFHEARWRSFDDQMVIRTGTAEQSGIFT
jgi:hypothetical protein